MKRDPLAVSVGLAIGLLASLCFGATRYVPSPNLHFADPSSFSGREFMTTADDADNRALIEGITAPNAPVQFATATVTVLVWDHALSTAEQNAAPNGSMFLVNNGTGTEFAYKEADRVRDLKLWAADDPDSPVLGVAVKVGDATRMVKRTEG